MATCAARAAVLALLQSVLEGEPWAAADTDVATWLRSSSAEAVAVRQLRSQPDALLLLSRRIAASNRRCDCFKCRATRRHRAQQATTAAVPTAATAVSPSQPQQQAMAAILKSVVRCEDCLHNSSGGDGDTLIVTKFLTEQLAAAFTDLNVTSSTKQRLRGAAAGLTLCVSVCVNACSNCGGGCVGEQQ